MTPPERISEVVARVLARLERRRRRRRLPPAPPPARRLDPRRLEALPVDLEVSIRDRLGVSWHDRPRNLKDGTR